MAAHHTDGAPRGRDAIRHRYLTEVRPINPPIVNDRYIADEQRCAVGFEVDHPTNGLVSIVDVFTVDVERHLTRLAVYRRGRFSARRL